ncbi:MAG TPA: DUF3786 domain-containing protein [Sedimentisphaerales bacterium]|nr:DUF3786 domain-containing protein [Sedimentisphaerales bacterium]
MAHEGLWEQLNKLDRQETAKRAKCQYLTDPQRYVITLLNTEYVVNLADRQIFSTQPSLPPTPAEFLEQLCLLAYLINAQDIPLANKFVGPENLPSGQFFFRGLHSLPTERLEETFGKSPERLYEVSEQFGAKRCEFGDASVELYVLPRVPLKIIIWRGDEEFDARASILFDQTAGTHLPLDALGALVNLTVKALVRAPE